MSENTNEPVTLVGDHIHYSWRPFLIAILVAALFLGIAGVVRRFAPGGPWIVIAVIAFLVALEGIYTTHWLADPERRTMGRLRYRSAELLVIILVVRLLVWWLFGNWPQLADLRPYLLNPLRFVDPLFLLFVILAVLAWRQAISLAELFLEVSLTPQERAFYKTPRYRRSAVAPDRPIDIDRSQFVRQFSQQWILGGFTLVLAAALTTFDLSIMEQGFSLNRLRTVSRLGMAPEVLLALLIYFLIGFWLLSQARLEAMESRWISNGVVTGGNLPRLWRRTSLFLLLAVALIATFLPIGSTLGLSRILQALLFLAGILGSLLFFLLNLLLVLILSPFAGEDEPPAEPPALEFEPMSPPIEELFQIGETTALIFGGLFWLVVIAITIAALLFFLHGRGYPLNLSLVNRLGQTLARWLWQFWQGLSSGVDTISDTIRARLTTRPETGGAPSRWRFIRINALPPRQQIRYFYLSAVRRAGQQGVARRSSETPLEYARDLKESWPEAETDVEELTGAFLRARYSPQEIERAELNPIKQAWKRVRDALRKRLKRDTDSEKN